MQIFDWIDRNSSKKSVKIFNQVLPIFICLSLLAFFMAASYYFIVHIINPKSIDKIQIVLYPMDVVVGFFLYFVTAVDYALIVGRMQIANPGSRDRVIMNICTCLGCFFGVTIVLFLWGLAKEIPVLIIALLTFAGGVMVKLAYEGISYFENSREIPLYVRKATVASLKVMHYFTDVLTFWMPELGSPKVTKMGAMSLAKWSLFLPFIIGLDDLVGYMGAMTIYNVFSLLFGIYLADILIDILIFISPTFTKKMVENSRLSFLAALAFIYLAYKSFSEMILLFHEDLHFSNLSLLIFTGALLLMGAGFSYYRKRSFFKTS